MDKKVIIKELVAPNIKVDIDGTHFELLCEFQSKYGGFERAYIQEDGKNVIIESSKGSAVVGLFSVEHSKERFLFDYVESMISGDDGLVTWQSGSMEHYLLAAQENGGKYPFICTSMGEKTQVPLFYRQISLDKTFLKTIEDHTVAAEHVRESLEFEADEDMFFEEYEEEESTELPKVVQAGLLPPGWNWVDYPDGSGHLESPEGKAYFIYDVSHGAYVEFKRDAESQWSTFPGLFEDFKFNAERAIQEHVIDDVGGLKNMDKLNFYVIDDKNSNFSIEYFEDVGAALERFQEACVDSRKFPALGVRVGDGSLDLLHGVGDAAVLVPDYRYTWNFSEPMKAAEGDIREAVRWLIEERGAAMYEYQHGLLPGWMEGDVTVLVPVTLGDAPKSSYCDGKVLKTELQSGIDAIDSMYIELHGWVAYEELLRHPKEYAPEGFIKVPQMNVVYVQDKNVVGIDGRMDIAPCDFKAMVNDINKPYSLIVYDGAQYTGQFRDKHDFIVASYEDAALAVKGWYELQDKKQVPALVQNLETREVLFNGYDENDKRMSFEEAAKKFGFDNDVGLDDVLSRASQTASERNVAKGQVLGMDKPTDERELN